MTQLTEHRKLAAIMFTDMVGYSALAQRNEALALEVLEEHRAVVRGILPQHGGREVKTTGDGFLIEFPSALAAVQCAIDVQAALHARNLSQPEDRQVQIRIGIHVGDVVVRDGDVHGDGVNLAARIEPLAGAGGICLSRQVHDQVANKLEAQLAPLGRAELKNIEGGLEVFRVVLPWQRGAPARIVSSRERRWRMVALLVAAVTVVAVAYWAGHRGRSARESPVRNWRGERLGGPAIALQPRISPNGNELAFAAMDQGLTQVGVMMVESGDWRILTTNRTRGFVADTVWSRNGTEIYFVRRGAVFRVSKYGGEETKILEPASHTEVLPDDSLLVSVRGSNRVSRLYRHWIGRRTEALNALFAPAPENYGGGYRVLPGGREVVFLGWPADAKIQEEGLWLLDLQTDHTKLLDPNPPPRLLGLAYAPLAGNPKDNSIWQVDMADNLYRVVAGSRRDFPRRRTELSLTLALFDLDFGPDGSLYLDQVERPSEIFRFSGSNIVQHIPLSASYERREVLPLPGGRLLLPTHTGRQYRLVVMAAGRDPVPFLESREECREPIAMLGRDQVLCRVGTGTNLAVSVVSASDGKVLKRISAIPADDSLVALAGSPDGRTIYYVAQGLVWSVPVEGGSPAKVRNGEGVAPDPNGKFLVVQVLKPGQNQLVRVPLDGGPEVVLRTPDRLTHYPIAPNAVHPDGRIVVPVAPPDLWYWPAAILDPATGKIELVPETHADMLAPGWDEEGRVVAVGQLLRASLWRFRPEK